jgi:hypothetical protein
VIAFRKHVWAFDVALNMSGRLLAIDRFSSGRRVVVDYRQWTAQFASCATRLLIITVVTALLTYCWARLGKLCLNMCRKLNSFKTVKGDYANAVLVVTIVVMHARCIQDSPMFRVHTVLHCQIHSVGCMPLLITLRPQNGGSPCLAH